MRHLVITTLIAFWLVMALAPAWCDELIPPPPLPLINSPQNRVSDPVDRSRTPRPVATPEPIHRPLRSEPDDQDAEIKRLPPLDEEPLPPLEQELWLHGGSYLYQPEGDRLNWPSKEEAHYDLLRLPEDWQKPEPVTAFSEFLGADPVEPFPQFRWPGGYVWEPRFVGYGSYELFGFALEENNRRQDVIGHQLIYELDLRLTGTERFHVQFRPLGRENTGGSYYRFNDPQDYVSNATGEPQRYWFEGEVHSLLGGLVDPFAVLDYHIVAGRFPFVLHNSLLMNDEILGVVVNKNTIYTGNLSNLNIQVFYGFNDVDTFTDGDAQAYGAHATIDYRHAFLEATYAYANHDLDNSRNSHFAALSGTKLIGPTTLAGRALFKIGDRGGTGSGELFVLEANRTRYFEHGPAGLEYGVFYANAFLATQGWSNLGGANFNRLRTAFEVNPLVQISAGRPAGDTWGIATGVQLFRLHEDESWIPEFAFEAPNDIPVWGVGLRYLRKTGRRSFFEALGSFNFSDDPRFDREGVFLSETIVF